MIEWIFAQIPLWVYITATLLFVGAMFYFFSPILVPLWNITPNWVKYVLGVIAALFSAYVLGMNRASKAAKARQAAIEAQANTKREEIHRDVENRDRTAIDRDFDKWVR